MRIEFSINIDDRILHGPRWLLRHRAVLAVILITATAATALAVTSDPGDFQNGSVIDATQVNTRFQRLYQAVQALEGASGATGALVVDSSVPKNLSDDWTVLSTLTVKPATVANVALAAHAYIERPGAGKGRYELAMRTESCSGTIVGRTFWRPSAATEVFGTTINFVGFAKDVSAQTNFVLCGKILDSGAPVPTVTLSGFTAHW